MSPVLNFGTGFFIAETEKKMKLHVIHNERKKLQCVFNTLVIRNHALERLYEGGLIGFLDKHDGGECECNAKITVLCYMGFEFDEIIDDLVKCGMKFLEDFCFIDAGAYEQFVVANDINQRVHWLKCRYADGYIYAWYNYSNQEDALI